MLHYDLNIFSPNEFEEFSRDILQAKLKVFIESFKTGKDGGVDLRFSTLAGENVIIQSKRYKNVNSLLGNLKAEVLKVQKLDPYYYIITTSVDLSPHDKNLIKKLFEPYIKSKEDIYGKSDLLNILGQHSKIENKYYKLWISSTNILKKVLHGKIYNQSVFELEEIKIQAELFVQNDNFHKALNILKKYRYIIISGIPGIGKTTLSRVLIQYFLSVGYEEFVYLNNIDDGYTHFEESKRQVYLFDDFLGRNFFEAENLFKNDDKIVKFIRKIKFSSNKIIIFVTREYILNQAMELYESFKIDNIGIAKCTIDLHDFSKMVKAKILYNHLYFGDVPSECKKIFIENNNYEIIISHQNYNPRIIEAIIKQQPWYIHGLQGFFDKVKGFFDNPESIWLYSFENSLDKFSQYTLFILSTLGAPVSIDDLELAVEKFFFTNLKLGVGFDSTDFLKSIKKLENSFIKTYVRDDGKIAVEYQNPSVFDFLLKNLNDKDRVIKSLIISFAYIRQFYTIFSGHKSPGKILLKPYLIEVLAEVLVKQDNFKISTRYHHKSSVTRQRRYSYAFLNYLNLHYAKYNNKIKEFVYQKFNQQLIFGSKRHHSDYISLLEKLDLSKFEINESKIMESFLRCVKSIYHLELFEKFGGIFPESYKKCIDSGYFTQLAYRKIIDSQIDDSDDENYQFALENMNDEYDLGLEFHINEPQLLLSLYSDLIDNYYENLVEEDDNEDILIREMFDNLIVE